MENIKTYAEIIGIHKTSNLLVPALAKIVDESLQVKLQFLKSLLPFIDYLCSNGDEGINILRNNMFNIILELYNQKSDQAINEEMKKYLFKNFIKLSKAILPYDKDQFILNVIIAFGNEDNFRNSLSKKLSDLAKNKRVDEHKALCIKYIRKLAEGFGKENAERYLLPQLISFTVEKNDDIKKELLICLPCISEIVSYEYISNKVYDILKRISYDLNPTLRKICINVLAKVIKIFKNMYGNLNQEEYETKVALLQERYKDLFKKPEKKPNDYVTDISLSEFSDTLKKYENTILFEKQNEIDYYQRYITYKDVLNDILSSNPGLKSKKYDIYYFLFSSGTFLKPDNDYPFEKDGRETEDFISIIVDIYDDKGVNFYNLLSLKDQRWTIKDDKELGENKEKSNKEKGKKGKEKEKEKKEQPKKEKLSKEEIERQKKEKKEKEKEEKEKQKKEKEALKKLREEQKKR